MKIIRMLYLVFANTLVLFFFILLGTHCFILLREHTWISSEYLRLPEVVRQNYEHMTAADVDALLAAHGSTSFRYESWVGFRVAAYASKFVNVNDFGIRTNGRSKQKISSLDNAVWFFGGSTTYGDGVTDEETIPAQVEKALLKPVINFGVPAFYSAQENMLLAQHLKFGYRPSLVLFLDGINESCDMWLYQDEMKLLFAKAQIEYEWDFLEIAKPVFPGLTRVAAKLKQFMTGGSGSHWSDKLVCDSYGRNIPLRTIHSRNLDERASICKSYAIECITYVQPFAGVHGKHEDMSQLGERQRQLLRAKFAHLEPSWRAANSVFVTDALNKHAKHAYVDDVHYSAAASKLIAQAIVDRIRGKLR